MAAEMAGVEETPQSLNQGEESVKTTSEEPVVRSKPEEKSGIRRRIKINVPGIISTDKSSNRPPPYKWAQQRLPACRPVYNGLHVFIVFSIIGVVLVILGGVFLGLNLQLREYKASYTNCESHFPNSTEDECTLVGTESDFPTCADYVRNISRFGRDERNNMSLCPCYCEVPLVVEENMSSPVYVYYELNNYYQNHRRFVNSWSPRTLRANDIDNDDGDCSPFARKDGVAIWPCGLIANSFFNDTLWIDGLTFNQDDIAWETDREVRFRNPPSNINPLNTSNIVTNGTVLPPNWPRLIDFGQRNQSFMVWFRVAAFPNFRKLYGRVNGGTVPAGNYTLNVVYNYPVTEFNGEKFFVISEVSWLGTRNLFLGSAYLVTGGLSILVGLLLLIVHLVFSRWKTSNKNFLDREF